MKFNTLILPFLAATLAGASPCQPAPPSNSPSTTVTPAQILAIAPKSQSCANATDFVSECATASQAAPALSAAFKKYGLTNKAEQAAVLGIIAFESGEFRYNKNHFPSPGVEGKGTRNMQSVDFNKKYAASIPEIADRFEEIQDQPGPVLDLLLEDPVRDFGSGVWFLTTQCEESVREGLRNNGEQGWEGFIVDCVGTDANDERKGYWTSAVKALGA
ncbi:hypothetical protein AN6535.2 [Aspergillus nidulans FGSC A4]|uniref:Uncharacterized protein n=1 Tax=Emericella nidulans (strain FGSC A4 / ATCC 38163 / CBS 112.46 / NRRL 194 / M139) TaxID=227321 RepID=Q5AYU5_EMENI|nr:hypothetical protein [Aspergillus nidulans FGSC A4]EAA57875.1 hypothetical protein AN6535.2 [Aspergillus nidulans FGSC A4]CBF70935.1 TPA: conserved hypothetical protein [Aspergillus nidulans FGSC A4]|eukprot:XP_664139.1 hypothetical protein AN6535.2 [Aspergillus nidulans FGSC A4]